jgi:mono/diheme cytochrome c family protein
MFRFPAAATLATALCLAAAPGLADPRAGAELYARHCAICHQANGAGFPPGIPALNGSYALEDAYTLVANTHVGGFYMPAFPELDAAEIAAIAGYVRNAWDNAHGEVTVEEVAALMEEAAGDMPQVTQRSIWDGVYTRDQARRGQELARAACGMCHGTRMNGVPDDNDMRAGPPLARAYFLREWEGRSLGTLFTYSKWTMPQANPGFLPDEDYAAIIAFTLSLTDVPPGRQELPADAVTLGHIMIGPRP